MSKCFSIISIVLAGSLTVGCSSPDAQVAQQPASEQPAADEGPQLIAAGNAATTTAGQPPITTHATTDAKTIAGDSAGGSSSTADGTSRSGDAPTERLPTEKLAPPQPITTEEVKLGDPELTSGIPGGGPCFERALVTEWYDKGGHPNPQLDEKIKKLNLSAQEKADLLAFTKALTGELPQVERGRLPE